MAHPKSRTSKQRKNKRRTHHKLDIPQVAVDTTTGQSHLYHRAHWYEGKLYYKGRLMIDREEE